MSLQYSTTTINHTIDCSFKHRLFLFNKQFQVKRNPVKKFDVVKILDFFFLILMILSVLLYIEKLWVFFRRLMFLALQDPNKEPYISVGT